MSIYQRQGYKCREDYLRELAAENELKVKTVFALAEVLGPEEDFDGLVSEIQDIEEMRGW